MQWDLLLRKLRSNNSARTAVEFFPVNGIAAQDLAEAAQLASLADETPEGRSIVVLAKEKFGLRGQTMGASEKAPHGMHFIPFTAQTRMSGVNFNGTEIRKGAPDTMMAVLQANGAAPHDLKSIVDSIARTGGTPLVVTRNHQALGVIHLKDIVKGGMKERFVQLRKMGIKTVMITGDNPLTATATQPAREAANMIDLDSNPTKLIEIVEKLTPPTLSPIPASLFHLLSRLCA